MQEEMIARLYLMNESYFVRDTELPRWKIIEWCFLAALLVLRVQLLRMQWGHLQGFDAGPYMEMFERVDWFQAIPDVRASFTSYHPPLTYLLNKLIFFVYPHAVESSQMLSWLSVTGGLLFLRATLKYIGVLWTIPGICLFYLGASLPLFIFLSYVSSVDPLSFFWMMLALYLSVRLFWDLPEGRYRYGWRELLLVIFLMLTLAAGLLTKFTGLLSMALPFLVILVRAQRGKLLQGAVLAFALCGCTALIVSPFYYAQYYRDEGKIFPISLEWQRVETLQEVRYERDTHPIQFVSHMLRIPEKGFWKDSEPTMDSFFHSIWLQLWKRDAILGSQSPLSLLLSNMYIVIFFCTLVLGMVYFPVFYSRRMQAWNQLGYLLFGIALIFFLAMIVFAYQYPVWDWRVFKAKYMIPAFLWIPYCVGLIVHDTLRAIRIPWLRILAGASAVLVVFVFMFLNHVLPVY